VKVPESVGQISLCRHGSHFMGLLISGPSWLRSQATLVSPVSTQFPAPDKFDNESKPSISLWSGRWTMERLNLREFAGYWAFRGAT